MRSALLPDHHGLIVATDREGVRAISVEGGADDVLTVATVGTGLGSVSAGVTEQLNEAVVVTNEQVVAIR